MLNPRNWDSSAAINLQFAQVTHLKNWGLGSGMLFTTLHVSDITPVRHHTEMHCVMPHCCPSESKNGYTAGFMNVGPLCVAGHSNMENAHSVSQCRGLHTLFFVVLSKSFNPFSWVNVSVLIRLIELLSDQLHEFYGLKVGDEKILTFLSPH